MKFSTETLGKITDLLVTDLAEQLKEGSISFNALEQGLREALQSIGQASIGQMLTLCDQQSHGVVCGCSCGQRAKRISRREAQILSIFGWVRYRRSYYACRHCGRRWYALDEREHLRAGRASAGMSRLLGMAGVTVSFEEAQRHIREYLLVVVSINTIRSETQRIGRLQFQRENVWRQQSQDLEYLQDRERHPVVTERLYGSIDGAFVPLEEGWKEEKTICWYQAGQRYGSSELRATHLQYYTSLEEAAPFGELVWASGLQHHVDHAKELIFVCDAAAWIWKLVQHYFPNAIQIVDWYHACQRLYAVAETLAGYPEPERTTWLEQVKAFLWEGELSSLIQTLQSLRPDHPNCEVLEEAITYYQNNQARMDYAYFRAQGYFIGSGTVESACKQIVALRLKRAGARWVKAGASTVAKARAAWLSHQWADLDLLPLAG
jgi:hypothetical protein